MARQGGGKVEGRFFSVSIVLIEAASMTTLDRLGLHLVLTLTVAEEQTCFASPDGSIEPEEEEEEEEEEEKEEEHDFFIKVGGAMRRRLRVRTLAVCDPHRWSWMVHARYIIKSP
jgi:hypothetical protein